MPPPTTNHPHCNTRNKEKYEEYQPTKSDPLHKTHENTWQIVITTYITYHLTFNYILVGRNLFRFFLEQ